MLGHSLAARLHGTAIEVTIALPGFISEGMGDKGGWRPFAVTPMTAAERIVRAAERGRLEVSFPAVMVWLLRGLRLLPPRLRFAAYQKMSGS